MIDELNMKIISLLEKNGRISFTQLAKSLKVSNDTVSKRVEALLEKKAITIRAMPQLPKMGYKARALVAMSVKTNEIDELSNMLTNNPNVSLIVNTIGYYNLVVVISFFTWDALYDFIFSELSIRKEILNMEYCFIQHAMRAPFIMSSDSEYKQDINVDEIDRKIIQELFQNGRYTARYLSNLLNISISSAAQRIKRLIATQVIEISSIINPSIFGESFEAIILINTTQKHILNIVDNLRVIKEAKAILIGAGSFNIYIRIASTNPNILYEIIKQHISLTNDISRMETLFVSKTLSGINKLISLTVSYS